jgi:formate dehydrogenase subunit gamma
MARNIGWVSLVSILLGFLMGSVCAQAAETPAQDQARRQITQPGNNAPFWREVRKGENPYQTSQVRGVETNILIQSAGQTWRQVRNGPISAYGGLLLIAVPVLLFAFYRWKGPMRLHEPKTGRLIERFTDWGSASFIGRLQSAL